MKKKIFKAILAGSIAVLLLLWFVSQRDKTITTVDIHEIQQQIKYQTSPDITADDLYHIISVLASDSLEGRAAGTLGEKKAIDFICEKFFDYGLNFHLQPFPFLKRESTWYDCSLSFGRFHGELNRDFRSLILMNSSYKASGEVVFVGYGYDYSKNGKTFNDYKNVDVRGKWVMIFEGDRYDKMVPKANQSHLERYDIAQKNGAIGVMTIYPDSASNGRLVPGDFRFASIYSSKFLIPMIRISGKTADSLFRYASSNTSEAIKKMNEHIHIPVTVSGSINSRNDSLISNNIIANLEGKDSILNKEYIIVAAHYDHLGMRTFPTITGDSTIIFYGADDNASGTAGVMELAEKLVTAGNLKRSIMFVLFGAEEQGGLPGSRYFCENFPVPQEKIKLMINMDMIGRMDSLNNVYVQTDVANNLLLKKAINSHIDITLVFDTQQQSFKSDHRSFASKKIPVICFTTGNHEDYHTTRDNVNSINIGKQKQLLNLIYDFICLKAETVAN